MGCAVLCSKGAVVVFLDCYYETCAWRARESVKTGRLHSLNSNKAAAALGETTFKTKTTLAPGGAASGEVALPMP